MLLRARGDALELFTGEHPQFERRRVALPDVLDDVDEVIRKRTSRLQLASFQEQTTLTLYSSKRLVHYEVEEGGR